MERRLAEIPTEEWGDVQVDITPREYVLDYLAHSFPVQLYEPFTDGEGNLSLPAGLSRRPAGREPRGRRAPRPPDREARLAAAGARRARPDRAALRHRHGRRGHRPLAPHRPQGRSPAGREPRRLGQSRRDRRPSWMTTSASSSSPTPAAPAAAITPSCRRGTGACASTICSEPGWKADAAIQGLGRTNRTNQAQPPLFRPIATDVKAEKRFLSHDRAPARHARRHHHAASARPAGRACSGPRTISKATTAAMRCASSTCCWSRGKVEGCSLRDVRGRDRPEADRCQRHQGRAAADHDLPQPAAGAHHRPAEHPVHGLRAAADRPDRRRDRVRAPMTSGWRRSAPRASSSPTGARSTPIPAPAPRRGCSPSPSASAIVP